MSKTEKTHTYFRFTTGGDKISGLLAALPDYAKVCQFTAGGGTSYSAWGTYHCDRDTLMNAVVKNGGYGFYTTESFMKD